MTSKYLSVFIAVLLGLAFVHTTKASYLLSAPGGPLEFNSPPSLSVGLKSYDIIVNVTIMENTGCTVESYNATLKSSPTVVAINPRGCENSVKARAAQEAGALGILIVERGTKSAKGYAGFTAKQLYREKCECDNFVVAFILDTDLSKLKTSLDTNGYATVRLTSDENGWVTTFAAGGFWFIQIFAILLNCGALLAGIVRLCQFRMRLGFFELSVSQVSIVLEIIAAIARFITFLDPIYSRGFLPLLLTSICRQLAVCMTLMTNLLIGLFWLETTRKYADLVVSPWLRRFRVPFILVTGTILAVSIAGAVIIGIEIAASVVVAGVVDTVNFVIFGLSSLFYETIGIVIFLRLRSIQRKLPNGSAKMPANETSNTSSSDLSSSSPNQAKKSQHKPRITTRKLSAVRRTAILLLMCGIFMVTYIIFGLIPASQTLTSVPVGVAAGFFGLFLSLVFISLTKLWALRPQGGSPSSKVSSVQSAQSKTSGASSDH